MTFRNILRVLFPLAALSIAAAAPALAAPSGSSDLIVRYDQSQIVRLTRPVADIIIGNPSIADVTVQSSNVLVVTGKTFGVTNIIVLDADRKIIQERRVLVQRDETRVVNLHKAGVRQSYSCTPNCSPTLTIGDDEAFFSMVQKHNAAKTAFSNAESPGTQGQ